MTVESWLTAAIADAERRGLAALKPLLETLSRSTAALRVADASLRMATDRPAVCATPEEVDGNSTR